MLDRGGARRGRGRRGVGRRRHPRGSGPAEADRHRTPDGGRTMTQARTMTRVRRWTAWTVAVILLLVVVFLLWANIVMQGTRSAALQVWRDDRVAVRDAGDS